MRLFVTRRLSVPIRVLHQYYGACLIHQCIMIRVLPCRSNIQKNLESKERARRHSDSSLSFPFPPSYTPFERQPHFVRDV